MNSKNSTNYWLFIITGLIWIAFCFYFYLTYEQHYCVQSLFQDKSGALANRQHNFWMDVLYLLLGLGLTALLFYFAGRTFFGRDGGDHGATDDSEYIMQLQNELRDCQDKYDDLQANSFGGKISRTKETGTDPKASSFFSDTDTSSYDSGTSGVSASKPESSSTSSASSAADSGKRDDLKIIEGIGPKIQSILYDNGIYTWSTLSVTDPEKISNYLVQAGGSSYLVHDPTTWPEQAKLAADGKFDELKKLQDNLKGGRPK